MMNIKKILKGYNLSQLTIGVLGSHSALDVCRGAKDEGFRTLVITQKGREKVYSDYYKVREVSDFLQSPGFSRGVRRQKNRYERNSTTGCVDEVIELNKFSDILKPEIQEKLIKRNCIFIPHRSFEVYLNDYDAIENKFKVPMFGNRFLLRYEERTQKPNQYDLLEKAEIKFPKIFKNPSEIDRLVIVKAQQQKVSFERGFFFASNPKEFETESKKRITNGLFSQEGLDNAVIEEFVVGTAVNFNYFYSPVFNRLELVGTDTRRQTNLDGFLRLPAPQQIEALKHIDITFKEMGHTAITLPESLLEEAYAIGERFIEVTQKEIKPGVIGPFALQALIRPIFPELEIVVYDVSPRMPGSPGISSTPYGAYLYGQNISMGKRVAMEIKNAVKSGKLNNLIT